MDVYVYLTHGNLVDIKTVCDGILICACIPLTWLLVYKKYHERDRIWYEHFELFPSIFKENRSIKRFQRFLHFTKEFFLLKLFFLNKRRDTNWYFFIEIYGMFALFSEANKEHMLLLLRGSVLQLTECSYLFNCSWATWVRIKK